MSSPRHREWNLWAASILLLAVAAGCSDETTAQQPRQPQRQAPAATPRDQPAPEQTSEERTRREEMLVDREQLEEMLARPGVRIVDTRPVDEYLAAHIPGAVHVDVVKWQEKALAEGGLDDAAFWADEIGKLGVTKDTKVVVYGSTPTTTARIWWHFAYAGVQQPMLLDGGWDLWTVGGKPTETDEVRVDAVPFEPGFDKSLLMTKEQLKGALGESEEALKVLDTRSADEYTGREARGGRGGHVPGAVHCEWSEMLDANGRFKSTEEIRRILADRGVAPDDRLVTHCQSGGRASLELFALRLAGFENVANFYGGWSQWSKDEAAPVEK